MYPLALGRNWYLFKIRPARKGHGARAVQSVFYGLINMGFAGGATAQRPSLRSGPLKVQVYGPAQIVQELGAA